MTAVGVALMAVGVWVVLGSPDLSGATLFGAVLFLLGLWIVQSPRPRRRRPRDSTDAAVEAQAAAMVGEP